MAIADRTLKGDGRVVRYVGFVTAKQMKRVEKTIRSMVYEHWDNAATSPPKARPAEEDTTTSEPNLQILAWQNGRPVWPEALSTRFAEGSKEHATLMEKKAAFQVEFPEAAVASSQPSSSPARVGGLCDYSVDEGKHPLDITREISLTVVPKDEFTEGRLELKTLARFCNRCQEML